MAQRVPVQLVDDVNGEEAQETVRFGFAGTEYEIDPTSDNAEKLRSVMTEYVDNARKASGKKRSQGAPQAPSKSKQEDTQQIRKWAQENGHKVSSRGRIIQSIIDAYDEAN